MCGVTRAPFNSNRSSCGIEVVVPFFFYPKFEHAQMCSVPIHRLVIENRAGAASNIATEAVVRASADGYTLLGTDAAAAINATLYDNLNFNFVRDIAAVAIIQGPLLV